ncbi:hypothetical protein JNO54_06255 [Janibacter sp. YIM B02568]|uniref:HD-GYP domain-containing protein n=1 Tax=Janibacter endophyticus TaxID=2806261 RepID=UPI001950BF6D|nr:HD domain-containing phosphohydrolase [Janibacter endophyticus]MBM6545740.1 hypothetical protein [Janibacter endophyticus]
MAAPRLALRPAVVIGVAALVLLWALLSSATLDRGQGWFVLVCLVSIVVGEVVLALRVSRSTAPISTGAATALVMTPTSAPDGFASAGEVIGVVGLAFAGSLVVGALLARWRGGRVSVVGVCARFLGAAATALACRGIGTGEHEHLLEWIWRDGLSRPVAAALLVLAAMLGWVVERAAHVVGAGAMLGEEGVVAGRGPVLDSAASGAIVASAPIVALSYPALGMLALPLYLLPIALVLFSVRRYLAAQRAQRETLLAISALPVVAGQGRPGHARRVADLSVAVARCLGLRSSQLRSVERVALLHDVGQVGLLVPLEHGRTIDASPQTVEVMAAASRRVARAAMGAPDLAEVIASVHTPYRRRHERGEDLPVEARIVKVVNAFDDLTEGAQGRRVTELALERLHLGLGYEYDPAVVAALEEVLSH